MVRSVQKSNLSGLRVVLSAVLCGFLLLWASAQPSTLWAQSARTELDSELALSIQIPETIQASEPSEAARQGALLVAKSASRGQAFPTFNVIRSAGPWQAADSSESQKGEQILNDYHAVGLKDSHISASSEIPIGAKSAFQALVTYRSEATTMNSVVVVLSFPSRHFFFTWTAPDSQKGELLALSRSMADSISWMADPGLSGANQSQPDDYPIRGYPVWGAVLICLGLAWALKRRLFPTRR